MSILRCARTIWHCLLFGWLSAACVDTEAEPGDDPVGLQCCVVSELCMHCDCDPSVVSIGDSRNEEACESFLEDQNNYGCDASKITAQPYREAQAIADCS